MKQNTQTHRSTLAKLLIMLLMIATMVCSFTIFASAADPVTELDPILIEDLNFGDLEKDGEGKYTKEYDGTTTVTGITLNKTAEKLGVAAGDDVTIKVTAEFATANAGNTYILVKFELVGDDAGKYKLVTPAVTVGATITPKRISWKQNATAAATYQLDSNTYEITFNVPALADGITPPKDFPSTAKVVVQAGGVGRIEGVKTDLGWSNPNYVVDLITVDVAINPIKITSIDWSAVPDEFEFGSAAAHQITVVGKDAGQKSYHLVVKYLDNEGVAYASVPGTYNIEVSTVGDNFEIAPDVTTSKPINIKAPVYVVGMNDTVFVGNAASAQNPSNYMIAVSGINGSQVPAELLSQIVYKVDGKVFSGASASGTYVITAELPAGYTFKNSKGETVTTLTATMTVNTDAVHSGDGDKPYQVILTGTTGVTPTTSAVVTTPEVVRKALKGFGRYEAYSVAVTGTANGSYSMIIGISDSLVHTRCDALTANDVYLYDALSGTLTKANEKYTVTVKEGYIEIAGITGDATLSIVVAPVYHPNFWTTALGIVLIILIVLAVLILLILIGLAKRKEKKEEEAAEEEEAVEAIVPVEEEETEACEELAEEVAEELAEEVPAEEEPAEEADATEEAAEALEELVAEAAEEELPVEEETTVPEELAEEVAEELAETEAEDAEAEADADALAAAVAEAVGEAVAEEEAVETVATVETEEDDDDKDDDNEDDDDNEGAGFAGFGMAGLKFIDINAEPEQYAEMLRQEAAGEVQLVYRYRRSYMSRLIQSQGSVQEYYNIIKNALLSYKGVKGRISWNYEAFNRGRVHVAKMNAKTKTLYLYLALDPEELADTKYGIIDVSSKKKYASVPVLMKIKGDRKFKYALELIEKLCAEQLQLPTLANIEETDYTAPYQNTEELVEAGFIKALCAAVPVAPAEDEEAVEEVVEETAPEAEAVTFVEPTDAPAVAEAAVEEAVEEEAAEEAVEEPVAETAEEAVEEELPATESESVTFVAPTDAPAVAAAAEEIAAEEADDTTKEV